MKVLRYLFPFVFALPLIAQTSAFTATITDPDTQTWNNGTWNAQIYSPNGPPASNGTPLTIAQSNVSGTMNGSGAMSGTLFDNSLLTPTGTLWRFTICPNASAPCSIGLVSVVGATPSLSTSLSNLITTAPRFPAGPGAYGYLDAEVSPTPLPGGTYYNVSTPAFRQWTGSAWATIGSSSGGGGLTNITGTVTAAGCTVASGACVVGTAGASVTFSAIPGTYTSLRMTGSCNVSDTTLGTVLDAQFNGDTGNDYIWQQTYSTGTTVGAAGSGAAAAHAQIASAPGNTGSSNSGSFDLIIPNYSATTFDKNVISNGTRWQSGSVTASQIFGTVWESTTAITAIKIFSDGGGNLDTGCTFSLYGVQ